MTTSRNPQTIKNQINRGLRPFNGYFSEIPLDQIFRVVRDVSQCVIVDEDGTPWSGLLCGESGQTSFRFGQFRFALQVSWFTMPSGRIEVTAYVS